jgi:LAS superfamily LD-carboxypeptidase LdcB
MNIILSRNEAQFDHLLKQHQTFWRIKKHHERKKKRGQAWSLPSFYKSRYANCQSGFNELGGNQFVRFTKKNMSLVELKTTKQLQKNVIE